MITEGMLDMFIFETEQGLENLENICLESKDIGEFDEDNVNEIFRIMHTIKAVSYTHLGMVSVVVYAVRL